MDALQKAGAWPPPVQVALHLWADLLRSGPPRVVQLLPTGAPVAVLCGDAALTSKRAAALLVVPGQNTRVGFSVVLPPCLCLQL